MRSNFLKCRMVEGKQCRLYVEGLNLGRSQSKERWREMPQAEQREVKRETEPLEIQQAEQRGVMLADQQESPLV
jgi:hypothetical protein